MPTCLLCENVQPAGEACEVCGRPFPRGEGIALPVAPLADLEPTAIDASGPTLAGGAPLESLEPTAASGTGPVAADVVAGLERTATAAVTVVAEPLPDLEPTAGAPVPGEAEPSGQGGACRYCRTPAPAGQAFCARCGMRLPAGDVGRERAAEGAEATCWQCGVATTRETCPACGARARS
jgi:hypothetical protein